MAPGVLRPRRADFGPADALDKVVIKPTSANQIGRQITAGRNVDVWIATTRHGSNTLRSLYRNMEVLAVSTSDAKLTLRATEQQAGRLIYVSGQTSDR